MSARMTQVCVFPFDEMMNHVGLCRKLKGPTPDHPNGQVGKLNGFGGGVEDDDASPEAAAKRELNEEIGLGEWNLHLFAIEEYPSQKGVVVYYYFACDDSKFIRLQQMTQALDGSPIETHDMRDVEHLFWSIDEKWVWNVPYLLLKARIFGKRNKEHWPKVVNPRFALPA